MGKKKEQSGDVTIEGAPEVAEGPSYEEKLRFVSVIAKPMASKKLAKKVYKENLLKVCLPRWHNFSQGKPYVSQGDKERLKAQGLCQEWPERCAGTHPQGGNWSCDICWGRHTNRGDVPHARSVRGEGLAICLHTIQARSGHGYGRQKGMSDDDGARARRLQGSL